MLAITIDTEPDLHGGGYKGIVKGLRKAVKIFNKHGIKATFFTTCDCIEKYPRIFQKLEKEGHEIALHGYRHMRFDKLTYKEKEEQIKKSIKVFNKYLKTRCLGFRAPQLAIEDETLGLLEKYGFTYDSSYAPLNITQFIFFPESYDLWIKSFFSKRKAYKIRKELYEIPTSSLIMPFVSLALRIFPKIILKYYLTLLGLFYKKIVFFAHSWDFIELKKSRIDRTFSHKKVLENLDYLIKISKNKHKIARMVEMT